MLCCGSARGERSRENCRGKAGSGLEGGVCLIYHRCNEPELFCWVRNATQPRLIVPQLQVWPPDRFVEPSFHHDVQLTACYLLWQSLWFPGGNEDKENRQRRLRLAGTNSRTTDSLEQFCTENLIY